MTRIEATKKLSLLIACLAPEDFDDMASALLEGGDAAAVREALENADGVKAIDDAILRMSPAQMCAFSSALLAGKVPTSLREAS